MSNLIENILNKNLNEAKKTLNEALNEKALNMLEEIKKMLAAEQFTSLKEEHDSHEEMYKKGYKLHMQSNSLKDAQKIANEVGGIVVPGKDYKPGEKRKVIRSGTGSSLFTDGSHSIYVKDDYDYAVKESSLEEGKRLRALGGALKDTYDDAKGSALAGGLSGGVVSAINNMDPTNTIPTKTTMALGAGVGATIYAKELLKAYKQRRANQKYEKND